jgi:hypothetical protein
MDRSVNSARWDCRVRGKPNEGPELPIPRKIVALGSAHIDGRDTPCVPLSGILAPVPWYRTLFLNTKTRMAPRRPVVAVRAINLQPITQKVTDYRPNRPQHNGPRCFQSY